MTVSAYFDDLAEAAALWDDQAAELGALTTSLDAVDTGVLGSRVGTAARSFLVTWSGRVQSLGTTAAEHGAAISRFATAFGVLDEDVADRLQGLVPVGVETRPPFLTGGSR